MIKTKLLFVVLASTFAFASCKKDEKTAENAPKTAEPEAVDTTQDGEQAADMPATEEVAEPTAEPTAEPGAEAPAADLTREQVAEQALAMFQEMNQTVKAGNGDCEKIAAGLTEVMEKSKPLMASAKKFDENPEDKKWFDETYGEKVKATMTEMMGNMGECMSDPAIQKAFEGME